MPRSRAKETGFGLTSPEAHGLPGESAGQNLSSDRQEEIGTDAGRQKAILPFYLGIILVASVSILISELISPVSR